uniref:hypothetical protein n=1 Tax=Diaporthe sojae TaxID=165439 RepID=UPI00240ECB58|nr:hypothetical protein QAZ32_mgp02 [Diaporthe sojae]WET30437.1 hypothetical protein [Diaporthe sojae]
MKGVIFALIQLIEKFNTDYFIKNKVSYSDLNLFLLSWCFMLTYVSKLDFIIGLFCLFFYFLTLLSLVTQLAFIFFNSNTNNSLHEFGILIISVLWLALVLILIVLSFFIRQFCIQKILSFTSKGLVYLKDYLLKVITRSSGKAKITKPKLVNSKLRGSGPKPPKFDGNLKVNSDSPRKKRNSRNSNPLNTSIPNNTIFNKDNPKYKYNKDYEFKGVKWRKIIGTKYDINNPKYKNNENYKWSGDQWRNMVGTIFNKDNPKYKNNENYKWSGNQWRNMVGTIHDINNPKYKNNENYKIIGGQWTNIVGTIHDINNPKYKNNENYKWWSVKWTKIAGTIHDINNPKYKYNPHYFWSNSCWVHDLLPLNGGALMSELPNKTDPEYSVKIKSILEENKRVSLNKVMDFRGKPENQHTPLAKVLHELYKKKPSLFNKNPNTTIITSKFIDKIVSMVENNRNSD